MDRNPAVTETENGQQTAEAELERLRARVAALEAELVEVQARANAAVARCAGARLLAGALAPRPQRADAPGAGARRSCALRGAARESAAAADRGAHEPRRAVKRRLLAEG